MVMSDSQERVVFVHAKPGDESIVTGGTIARLRSDGAQVTVIFGSSGEQQPAATRAALSELDVNDWMVVPAVVGRSIEDDDRALDTLLVSVLARAGATAVVIGTDNDRLRGAAMRAGATARIPVFVSRLVASSPNQRLTAIDVTEQIEQKVKAISSYPGRWNVVDHTALESGGGIRAVTGSEAYAQVSTGAERADEGQPPLTLRGRIVGGVVALLVGVVFGFLGTIGHQTTVPIGGLDFPIGLIVALISASALLVGLRLVLHDRLIVLAAAIGLLGSTFVLSLQSIGGSVLIPAGLTGTLWTLIPALVAALVLAWPRIPARR